MLSLSLNCPIWFIEIICLRSIPCLEDLVNELEAENVDADDYGPEVEEEDHVDPAYLQYLAATHQELLDMVDEAGGELVMTNYSRFLLDELNIGRNVSPFYYHLGLEMIYEE